MDSLERSGSPLVSAVTSKIAEMIRTGTLAEGQGLPSERKLSTDFAVSRGVVRSSIKELTDLGLIEAKPRCRPVVSPHRSNSTTTTTSNGRRHICIWLWPNSGDYSGVSILKGIQSTKLAADVRLIIGHASGLDWESRWNSEAAFLRGLAEDPDDAGAIIWYLGGERNRKELEAVREAGIPTVFIDRLPPEGFAADFVGTNNFSAAKAAAEHLLNFGHRRIALITNMDPVSSVRERESGFHFALQTAGIVPDPALIQRDSIDEPEGIEAALDALFALESPPTAVFCINDQMALQVYEALQKRGMSIPEDVSVLGFDGLLRWIPGGGYLTTMCQDFTRIGQLAAEVVLERMLNPRPPAFTHYLLDAPLLSQGSTAPLVAAKTFKPRPSSAVFPH